jgi:hypothetical protein
MAVPAIVTCAGVAVLVPLSPCLILGWGPFPALGVAGGAVAVVSFYFVGSLALAGYLWSGRSVVRIRFKGSGFRWPLFYDILKVGVVAALITIQTNLTIAIATGLVGRFGSAAIAGYGTGSRLEYLLIPLVFGLGGPLVALVGTNIGAGQRERALRAAWIGAVIAAGLCELIGLCAAMFPLAWLSLFDSDPAMLEAGTVSAPSTACSASAWGFILPRKAPDGCCGHGLRTWDGLSWRPAAAGWRCASAATSRTYFWRLRWRWGSSGSSTRLQSRAAPGSRTGWQNEDPRAAGGGGAGAALRSLSLTGRRRVSDAIR